MCSSSSSRKRAPPISLDRSVTPPQIKRRQQEDARYVGHPADFPIRDEIIKIVSWNVNGTGPFLQKQISFLNIPSPLRLTLKRHGWPGLLCLQEVKIAPGDVASQRQLQRAANEKALPDEPIYEIVFSLPRDKYNATGFGGRVHGVATLLRKDIVGSTRTRLPDWDREGRILIHEFACGLVVVNGYWVNGTDHVYRDSTTGKVAGTRHDLKIRYHRRILEEVLAYQRQDKVVVLIGDMNVAREPIDAYPSLRISPQRHVENRIDFNDKFFNAPDGMRGIDVFRHFHGPTRKYTWHSTNAPHGRVCDRVDYVVASRKLLEIEGAVVASDICDSADARLHSDHVPIWIEIDLAKLMKSQGSFKIDLVGTTPQHSKCGRTKEGKVLV